MRMEKKWKQRKLEAKKNLPGLVSCAMIYPEAQMKDKTTAVFGNLMKPATIRKARKTKTAFIREFGSDAELPLVLSFQAISELESLGVRMLKISVAAATLSDSREGQSADFLAQDPKALVIGTIRMGFGHYRIALAMASAARSMGYTPYLFDLHSFTDTTAGRIVAKLNGLYSLGSRLSQKYAVFNKLYWEPLNSEGFRKLSYNAVDQKTAELMATPCRLLPRGIPFIATHAWPAQAAVHAGLQRVVNAIPDNWPMALHLAEGAIHTVGSPSSWFGYKILNGMNGSSLSIPMPPSSLVMAGHYVDHELVVNLEADTALRLERLAGNQPLRIVLTVGGAGAQQQLYSAIIRHLLPSVAENRVALFINAGDHRQVLEALREAEPELRSAVVHGEDWNETSSFAAALTAGETASGVHFFYSPSIFAAVYSTNLLLRAADLLISKPSELAFYPVPKLNVRRIGGHEAWGAIRSAEIGDGTIECPTTEGVLQMLDLLLNGREALTMMNESILRAKAAGVYSGAYRAVQLATDGAV